MESTYKAASVLINIVRLLRPGHWVKNFFMLIPLFFAGQLFHIKELIDVMLGMAAFSLVASTIYIINDYRDRKVDRNHPIKKLRPLAAGRVSSAVAFVLVIITATGGFMLSSLLDIAFSYILFTYAAFNIAYSFGLKRVPIIDMLIVALGFVLRVAAGGVINDIMISKWLLIMIFLLSLFLAIAKRRDDILLFMKSGVSVRRSTANYNLDFINSSLTMISTTMIVAYLMYTLSPEAEEHIGFEHLYVTAIFVITGVLRYLQITLVENNSSSPVKILYTDRFIQLTILSWVASFFIIIYFF